jgi:hypothetical protein
VTRNPVPGNYVVPDLQVGGDERHAVTMMTQMEFGSVFAAGSASAKSLALLCTPQVRGLFAGTDRRRRMLSSRPRIIVTGEADADVDINVWGFQHIFAATQAVGARLVCTFTSGDALKPVRGEFDVNVAWHKFDQLHREVGR